MNFNNQEHFEDDGMLVKFAGNVFVGENACRGCAQNIPDAYKDILETFGNDITREQALKLAIVTALQHPQFN